MHAFLSNKEQDWQTWVKRDTTTTPTTTTTTGTATPTVTAIAAATATTTNQRQGEKYLKNNVKSHRDKLKAQHFPKRRQLFLILLK